MFFLEWFKRKKKEEPKTYKFYLDSGERAEVARLLDEHEEQGKSFSSREKIIKYCREIASRSLRKQEWYDKKPFTFELDTRDMAIEIVYPVE